MFGLSDGFDFTCFHRNLCHKELQWKSNLCSYLFLDIFTQEQVIAENGSIKLKNIQVTNKHSSQLIWVDYYHYWFGKLMFIL